MGNIKQMLDFAKSKHKRVAYSMAYPQRLGPNYYDCSSFVYYSLIAGGFLPKTTRIGNTETLYKLRGKALDEVYSYDDIRPGDIFIRGEEGKSLGPNGHTGIFLRKDSIIHCNYTNRGVSINDENSYIGYFLERKRGPRERYFRPKGQGKIRFTKGWGLVKAVSNVRSAPSLRARIVAQYGLNDVIYFDQILENEGYVWISYIALRSGLRRYVAISKLKGGAWIEINR
ncbi:MAG: peptidoglycan amidohydrolase family protein [Anaerococcus sp.]|nr:peptidoglycan amidohydrolase family protein [Anaerococcus sp.]